MLHDQRHQALARVLRDLNATAPGMLEVADSPETILLLQPDGAAVGLPADWEDFPADVCRLVAEAVQEAIIEALWSQDRSPVWPECPDHPNAHPLQVDERGQFWCCPASTRAVAGVGQLASDPL